MGFILKYLYYPINKILIVENYNLRQANFGEKKKASLKKQKRKSAYQLLMRKLRQVNLNKSLIEEEQEFNIVAVSY